MLITLRLKSVLHKENETMILLCKSLYLKGKMDTFSLKKDRNLSKPVCFISRKHAAVSKNWVSAGKKLVKPR